VRIKKVLSNKGFWISVGVVILFLSVASYLVFSGEKKSRPQTSFPNVATTPNPSPLNPANSPNVAKAQEAEIEWLKKHGKYFEWGDAEEKNNEKPQKKQPDQVVVVAKPSRSAEEKMIWETFWKNFPPSKVEGGMLSLALASTAGGGDTQGTTSSFRTGCPFRATVMRSSYATLKSSTPLLMKVADPANCAGLPVGTIVVASMQADYSSFRANVQIESLSLPDGTSVKAKGFAMGPDGLPGVGHKVVRNDRKTVGLSSLFEGIAAGARAAREDSTQTTCYEWGCEQTQTQNDNQLQEGILEGAGTMLSGIANGIVQEYKQVSPIVVTVPENFPVEIVLTQ
jgi:hypothetical protein